VSFSSRFVSTLAGKPSDRLSILWPLYFVDTNIRSPVHPGTFDSSISSFINRGCTRAWSHNSWSAKGRNARRRQRRRRQCRDVRFLFHFAYPTRLPAEDEVSAPPEMKHRRNAHTYARRIASVVSRDDDERIAPSNGNATIVPFYVDRAPLYDIAVWGTQASLILCVLYRFLYVERFMSPDICGCRNNHETSCFFYHWLQY